ncbi:aldo/keto reductase [Raoultella terrigena]|uniref:aldo/keto reductase n=1 Tax=Raoultella terrigena TaxID=577 RepID=UPI001E4FA1BC|nr:aldo/keto reductase [Raoultella terrigena]
MGSWRLGQGRRPIAQEEEAMRTGISLGMNLIDTAEMYGSGASEEMIGRVITGRRAEVFLVSKVLPSNATTTGGIRSACVNSLKRLGTDYLDLYLLHWRSQVRDLALLVDIFEGLKRDGLIRRWGVSNFDVSDMEELFSVAGGKACATNQVEYSLSSRSIERDLIPWSRKHGVPLMAYSPLGSDGRLLHNPALAEVASKHGVTPAAMRGTHFRATP